MVNLNAKGAGARVKRLPDARGAARLLAAIDDLGPELAARAAEIEDARQVCGIWACSEPCFRAAMAGWKLDVPEVLPLIVALAAADRSVGWVAMIGTTSQVFCTRLPRTTF